MGGITGERPIVSAPHAFLDLLERAIQPNADPVILDQCVVFGLRERTAAEGHHRRPAALNGAYALLHQLVLNPPEFRFSGFLEDRRDRFALLLFDLLI